MKTQVFTFILVLLSSCKPQTNTLINFDPSVIYKDRITLSQIADDISYIPLDNSFQIGLIDNYQILNNSIYLSAKNIGVLEYNKEGKFVRKIGSIGRGPGEYTYCFDFSIDDKKGTIGLRPTKSTTSDDVGGRNMFGHCPPKPVESLAKKIVIK